MQTFQSSLNCQWHSLNSEEYLIYLYDMDIFNPACKVLFISRIKWISRYYSYGKNTLTHSHFPGVYLNGIVCPWPNVFSGAPLDGSEVSRCSVIHDGGFSWKDKDKGNVRCWEFLIPYCPRKVNLSSFLWRIIGFCWDHLVDLLSSIVITLIFLHFLYVPLISVLHVLHVNIFSGSGIWQ